MTEKVKSVENSQDVHSYNICISKHFSFIPFSLFDKSFEWKLLGIIQSSDKYLESFSGCYIFKHVTPVINDLTDF